jgi:hypothetical protein
MLSLLGLSFVVSGCGQDFEAKVSCKTQQDCLSQTGTLFADGSSPDLFPQCCGGYCLLPSGGCESGYRYLTNDPSYGACVPTDSSNLCPAPPVPDMSMPVMVENDMSMMPDAAGDM